MCNYKVWAGYKTMEMPLADAVSWAITYDEDSTHVLGAIVGAIVERMREAGAIEDNWIERVTMGRVEVIKP